MLFPYRDKKPQIPSLSFIAPNAAVIGDVVIGEKSSVWFHVTIRGDVSSIRIGDNTNVQDGSVLHVDGDAPLTIGSHISIGHNATVHGCTIEDHVLIGMGATVLSHAKIGKGSLVAAGALIREGFEVPPNSLVVGIPGKVVRELSESERNSIQKNADHYARLAREYFDQFQEAEEENHS